MEELKGPPCTERSTALTEKHPLLTIRLILNFYGIDFSQLNLMTTNIFPCYINFFLLIVKFEVIYNFIDDKSELPTDLIYVNTLNS